MYQDDASLHRAPSQERSIRSFYSLHSSTDGLLYFDYRAGTLRHGAPDQVFKNLAVIIGSGRCWLVVLGSYHGHMALLSFENGRWKLGGPDLRNETAFDLDMVGEGLIAIRRDRRFLGGRDDGGLDFDRSWCREHEVFRTETAFQPPPSMEVIERTRHDLVLSISGPFNSTWSLSSVNRRIALLLHRARPDAVNIFATDAPLSGNPAAEEAALAPLLVRPTPRGRRHVVIHQRWPVTAPAPRGDLCAVMFFWEETRVPDWIIAALDRYDLVLAPTRFVEAALRASGLSTRITVSGFGPDLSGFADLHATRGARPRGTGRFTFLHVSSCAAHKGVDALLEAYGSSFRSSDPVRLVIKGYAHSDNHTERQIAELRDRYPDVAPISYTTAPLTRDEMIALYGEADCMVLPTRGEGFNLPAAEAIASGLGLIVTGFGGHMDFCRPDVARLLSFTMRKSILGQIDGASEWGDPDPDDLVAALREAFEGRLSRSPHGRDEVLRALDGAAWSARLLATLEQALDAAPVNTG